VSAQFSTISAAVFTQLPRPPSLLRPFVDTNNFVFFYLGRRRSSQDATDANCGQTADDVDTIDGVMAHKRHSLRSTTSFCDEVFLEAEEEGGEGVVGPGGGVGALSDGISLSSNDGNYLTVHCSIAHHVLFRVGIPLRLANHLSNISKSDTTTCYPNLHVLQDCFKG